MTDPDLCTHHTWTLHRWRETHAHETKSDFRRRCHAIARACPSCASPRD